MDPFTLFWLSFLAGIYAPVGAPCALILYPGYISFLAGKSGNGGHRFAPFTLGIFVAMGVIVAMLIGGLLFSAAVQAGGAAARKIIPPILFTILFLLSLIQIFDIRFGQIFNLSSIPQLNNPLPSAFFLGMTFGIIILPCNAAAVTVLLALAATTSGLVEGLGAFFAFGLGITLPLLVLAGLSHAASRQITGYLTQYQRGIRIIGGIIMLVISVWYLAPLFFPQGLL